MRGIVSTPASRAARAARGRDSHHATLELGLLGLALLLAGGGVGLAWYARTVEPAPSAIDGAAARPVVNVNALETADRLAPLLTTIDDDRERRLAAAAIVDYVRGTRTGSLAAASAGAAGPHPLSQVGDLARIRVAARTVEGRGDVPALRARLAALREGRSAPESVRLLDADALRAVRPSIVVRTRRAVALRLLASAALFVCSFVLVHVVRRVTGTIGDPITVPAVCALCALGFVTMVGVNDPLRDRLLFESFSAGIAIGCVALAAASQVDFRRLAVDRLAFVFLLAASLLSVLLLVLGSGPGTSGVKVNLFGVQPVELIRPLVALFLAGYFARRWEFLRELDERPLAASGLLARVSLPRRADVQPVAAGMGLVLLFFFLQRDLGPALVISCVFLATYGVARGRAGLVVSGLLVLVAGFAVGYWFGHPSTVVRRVAMWRSPWDNAVPGGDQVAHALWALASGGLVGQGAGRGGTGYIPTGENDLVLASLGEDLGFIGLAAALLLFGVVVARALRAAGRTDDPYLCLLVVGLVTSLAAQAALIAGGLLGLLPLSGVVTPFLSAGRSSMISNLAVVGLLLAAGRQATSAPEPLFARPVRALSIVMAACAVAIAARAFTAQAVVRDETLGRPVRTRQADGALRYQDNPRLREAALLLTRGTILDRNGLPLATSDRASLAPARDQYAQLGIPLETRCPTASSRCYPLGGSAFHLLGDSLSRANWGAPNTQFVERESDARLRGFGWRTMEGPRAAPGGPAREPVTVPDYAELVPLWDHRHDLSHPDAQRLLTRPRDVRVTLDARLQARVARLLTDRLEQHGLSRGAVVVLDARTGDVLALASRPWPSPDATGRVRPPASDDTEAPEWLDRARYGQYPPGSTFKLVTAAAALQAGEAVAERTFACRRLDDGRVGNELPGWRRPVRDDPTDRVPHGQVTLEEGLRVSCNAYFAQLGLAVGARTLRDVARRFGIVTAVPDTAERLRGQLPWASYGQAEVLASPLTMARVAATFANDGEAPDGRVVVDDAVRPPGTRRVLPPAQARRIARAMRSVVTGGTAHGLMSQGGTDPDIAGKTGTAEVADARSHSWFAGFAPASSGAGRTIAFAVIVENGGYGASVAVPLAGDVVSAARALDIIK